MMPIRTVRRDEGPDVVAHAFNQLILRLQRHGQGQQGYIVRLWLTNEGREKTDRNGFKRE